MGPWLQRQARAQALAALAAAALAGCGEVRELGEVADVGAGYVARTICTAVFVQGRAPEDVWPHDLGPDVDPRLALFRASIDREKGEVRAGRFGLTLASAGHTPGLGCAVGREGQGPGTPVRVAPDPRPFPAGDAASGNADGLIADRQALETAVAAAFVPGSFGNRAKDPVTRSVVIVHQGQLVAAAHADGWGPTTPHYSASMSKTVAAVLIGILVAEGKLRLDDEGLLPEWTDGRRAIRLAHLLDMESGLAFDETYAGPADPGRMLYAEPSASRFAAAKPLRDPPGTRFAYSSGDTNILMRVARLRARRDRDAWNRFPEEALFAPVGMRSALFEQDAQGDFLGSTFVLASANDWARFGLMLADMGRAKGRQVVPEAWVRRMRTPSALSKGEYSTQTWFRGGVPGEPGRTIELAGYGGQYVTIVPETRTVIVRMGFQPDRSAWDHARFLAAVFQALGVDAPSENRAS
ncbi:serine hydrolase domain-containing protein [Thermaurantiacus sp.]